MKSPISLTIDKDVLEKVEQMLGSGIFRSKSHVFEYAVRRLLEK
ncbi:ribbon-helix-helix protein, CopG family [Candidatus Woesearchaeota archaeon]|nr:ribbon-helix-helix protein, CopG family [Candidatus Woesearchaeota archaeon]MBT4150381.1 ribbon-helix-helix protein, CopG family [Candidatus Woesearchaeota archaeon]MBT4247381.1 ribbon-helix-helix protein, CopG family [Candidatus Woesearchaeota archaeon]MBT4434564.1 ribbon-helix-helix protein, CopG family [Candidatus Woesearchaeota archaeon]MBT7332005.1 ribbon-helix-helix protein, CopG family [Candidatus Woesearchaeota archaeon]